MNPKELFANVSDKISETLANSPVKDMEKNAKAMLSSAFSKMDLVTREEFDIQQKILIQTRIKLSETEARLAALEAAVFAQKEIETTAVASEIVADVSEKNIIVAGE